MTVPQRLRRALPEPLKAIVRSGLAAMRLDSPATARRKARQYLASRKGKPACLHLGCGPAVMDGWLNVDLTRTKPQVVACDLRKGLPFLADETIDFIYHEHFFEHLDRRSGRRLMEECCRVLKKSGSIRIALPDLDHSIRSYLAGYSDEEGEFADQRRALYGDQLLGTPGEALDMALRGWEHRFVYGEKDIVRMMELNGFTNVRRVTYRESDAEVFRGIETRSPEQSALIVEAERATPLAT
jgi:predicted SAM-dependent methyltransferase